MSNWRRTMVVGNASIDITSLEDSLTRMPIEASEEVDMAHVGCGGAVESDADSQGDWWWNFRCLKCGDTFQSSREWLSDE